MPATDVLRDFSRAAFYRSGGALVLGTSAVAVGLLIESRHVAAIGVVVLGVAVLHRTARTERRLAGGLDHLAAESAALREALDAASNAADHRMNIVVDDLDRAVEQLDAVRSRTDETNELAELLRGRLGRERSNRIVGIVNAISHGHRPEQIVVLNSIPRSASTLTLDVFRSMPGFGLWPSAAIWQSLGLGGRRFPIDLSGGASGTLELEVAPGLGDLIPPTGQVRFELPTVGLEKLHPSFFDFDVDRFVGRIEATKRLFDCEVVVVSVVRNPLDAMWSIAEYKQRNRNWLSDIEPQAIPEFACQTVTAMADLRTRVGGHVITYGDITGASDHLHDVLATLGDLDTERVREAIAPRYAGDDLASARSRGFVGDRSSDRSPDGPGGIWAANRELIERATEIHTRLVGSA